MRNFLIVLACLAIAAIIILGGIYLGQYVRQVRWEDFTKMHDYINNKDIGE